MKRILRLGLVAAMAMSAMPMAYATTDVSNGTEVEYLGSKTTIDDEGNEVYAEAYTVTVPAKMTPGGSAFVKAEGTWNSARKLVVTADKTVELENNINTSDKKTLDVTFNGINLVGNNNVAVANYGDGIEGEAIAVGNIENALFGTWSGVFEYQAEIVDNITFFNFTIKENGVDHEHQALPGMTWGEWLESEYNTDGYTTHGYFTDENAYGITDASKNKWYHLEGSYDTVLTNQMIEDNGVYVGDWMNS